MTERPIFLRQQWETIEKKAGDYVESLLEKIEEQEEYIQELETEKDELREKLTNYNKGDEDDES